MKILITVQKNAINDMYRVDVASDDMSVMLTNCEYSEGDALRIGLDYVKRQWNLRHHSNQLFEKAAPNKMPASADRPLEPFGPQLDSYGGFGTLWR